MRISVLILASPLFFGCGSVEDNLHPRLIGDFNGQTIISPTSSPSPSPTNKTSVVETRSMGIAKQANTSLELPNSMKSLCANGGARASWRLKTDTNTLTLGNTSECSATISTTQNFAQTVEIEATMSTDTQEFTYQLTLTPATCAQGQTEQTSNPDGSPRCIEAASMNYCLDHFSVQSYQYIPATSTARAQAKLLFAGANPDFGVNWNCAGDPGPKYVNLSTFDLSKPWVLKGEILHSGNNIAAWNYEFCILPSVPNKIYFKAKGSGCAGGEAGIRDIVYSDGVRKSAYCKTHSRSGAGTASLAVSNVGLRYGETTCGEGYSEAVVIY